MKPQKTGEILVQKEIVTSEQLETALVDAKKKKKRLGEILIQMGLTTDVDICRILAGQLKIPVAGLTKKQVSQKVLELVPADFCYKNRVVPLGFKERTLWVAMSDPTEYDLVKDISFITGCRVKPAIDSQAVIIDFLLRYYPPPFVDDDSFVTENDTTADMVQFVENLDDQDDISFVNLEKAARGGVIRHLTNGIIANAIKQKASDIHIEPQEEEVIVRFRVDGIMRDVMTFTKIAHPTAVSRIKIMSGLDITERRTPQDGRVRIRVMERSFDLRVSSLPTYYGEKIVIRLLEARLTLPLEKLGMGKSELARFKKLLKRPQGLVVITGPTGSGKTTTLYAALGYIYSPEINIVTIEDPVEYSLPGINQVQVNTATGMTFAKGLRSLLRQDPDVVMIGEIRDEETASIAFQIAQTGHLVLTTLHTNDAVSAVVRLRKMGIEPFWTVSSLLCVVSQRLIRKIHEECCEETAVSRELLAKFSPTDQTVFKRGTGCPTCQGIGYLGRMAIFEMLVLTPEIETMIVSNAYTADLHAAAQRSGMSSLTQEGFDKALQGLTTVQEVMRVAPPVEEVMCIAPSVEKVMHMASPAQKPIALERDVSVIQPEISGRSESFHDQAQAPAQKEEPGLQDCVLVVDDDEAIQRFVKRILTNEFYAVRTAGNARDGLKRVFLNPPDLILVDYDMPEINGIQFIEKLKTHSRMAHIPVIMLTATQSQETEVKALTMGADDWISKPIVKERLLARIKRLLKT